jgi:hypothetical protein
MNIGNVEKKKRGCKPKANPQVHRLMIRLNNTDMERFLSMYRRSGKRSYSAFIADCVLNKSHKVIEINKTAIDFTILLSSFFVQFRAAKNNFNQVYTSLTEHFGKQKAVEMIRVVTDSTVRFRELKNEIEAITLRFREKCLPK